ncbi:MAG TPA: hypothetical protein VM912_20680 [Terriglobales bacterium]|nr:hypothetical protein [Terriglobales bacterium]
MVKPNRNCFSHRPNRHGTTDSICLNCFATVCTSAWEADLERAEEQHFCDPFAWNTPEGEMTRHASAFEGTTKALR